MTPFRWESSTFASVWLGGSEFIVVGDVWVSVIVIETLRRVCEKAVVITELIMTVSSWIIPLVYIWLLLGLCGRPYPRTGSHLYMQVCQKAVEPGSTLSSGACTALLAALPPWLCGWNQARCS